MSRRMRSFSAVLVSQLLSEQRRIDPRFDGRDQTGDLVLDVGQSATKGGPLLVRDRVRQLARGENLGGGQRRDPLVDLDDDGILPHVDGGGMFDQLRRQCAAAPDLAPVQHPARTVGAATYGTSPAWLSRRSRT